MIELPEPYIDQPGRHPDEVHREARSLRLQPQIFRDREFVEGLTIDGPTSKDLDDAIGKIEVLEDGGFRVQVHIADVASLVTPETLVFREALARVYTRYYGNYNDPMIPRMLSENQLSLLPGQMRPTITITVEVGPNLEIRTNKTHIERTCLGSDQKMHYAEAAAAIQNPGHKHHEKIAQAHILAERLIYKRRLKGALLVYDLKQGLASTEEGKIVAIKKEERHPSHLVIQELMILANKALSLYMIEKEIPCLFRNHTVRAITPERDSLLSLYETALTDGSQLERLRQQVALYFNRATYGPTLEGHYALNEPAYLHGTSPIRRIADLLTHQNLVAYLAGEPLPHTMEDLERAGAFINEAHDQILERKTVRIAQIKDEQRRDAEHNQHMIQGLTESEFRKVLTSCATSSGPPSEIVMEELERRWDADLFLKEKDYLIVLAVPSPGNEHWMEFRGRAMKILQQKPHLAVSILNMAPPRLDNWEDSTMEINRKKAPGGICFRATPKVNSKRITTPKYARKGRNNRESKRNAALYFWECYAKGTVIDYAEVKGIEPDDLIDDSDGIEETQITPEIEARLAGNPIGEINDFCAQHRLPNPRFEFQQIGEGQETQHSCTLFLELDGDGERPIPFKTPPILGKQKDAKALAAAIALHWMDTDIGFIFMPRETLKDQENHIGQLQMLCEKRRIPSPKYEEIETPEDYTFAIKGTLVYEGETIEKTGLTKGKKKTAQQDAARQLLEELQKRLTRIKIDELSTGPTMTSKPGDTPIGMLNNLCQKQGEKKPLYSIKTISEDEVTATASMEIAEECFEAESDVMANEKHAKHHAAYLVLQKILAAHPHLITNEIPSPPGAQAEQEPVKSDILESYLLMTETRQELDLLCLEQGWPSPEYKFTTKSGKQGRIISQCQCIIRPPDQKEISFKGGGGNNELAQKRAIAYMLQYLRPAYRGAPIFLRKIQLFCQSKGITPPQFRYSERKTADPDRAPSTNCDASITIEGQKMSAFGFSRIAGEAQDTACKWLLKRINNTN